MRTMLALLSLLVLASPLAVAQDANDTKTDEQPTRPDDAAWVDDCPPDMMCAYGGHGGDDEPQQFGPEGCIDCSGLPPEDHGRTCMDGADENETCDPDVQYLDGGGEPTRGPEDGSCENCRGEDAVVDAQSDAKNAVPLPQLLVVIAALAGAAALVSARRGRVE